MKHPAKATARFMKLDWDYFWDQILVLWLGEKTRIWSLANLRIIPSLDMRRSVTLGSHLRSSSLLPWLMCHNYPMVLKTPWRAQVQGNDSAVVFPSFLILTCDLDYSMPDASQQGVCLCTLLHSRLCARPEDGGDVVITVPLITE